MVEIPRYKVWEADKIISTGNSINDINLSISISEIVDLIKQHGPQLVNLFSNNDHAKFISHEDKPYAAFYLKSEFLGFWALTINKYIKKDFILENGIVIPANQDHVLLLKQKESKLKLRSNPYCFLYSRSDASFQGIPSPYALSQVFSIYDESIYWNIDNEKLQNSNSLGIITGFRSKHSSHEDMPINTVISYDSIFAKFEQNFGYDNDHIII